MVTSIVESEYKPMGFHLAPTMISCPAYRRGAGQCRSASASRICQLVSAISSRWKIYVAKEDQLEYAQWSLVALLKHLQMILQIASQPGTSHSLTFGPETLQRRLDQITLQIVQIEQAIEETRLPVRNEGV